MSPLQTPQKSAIQAHPQVFLLHPLLISNRSEAIEQMSAGHHIFTSPLRMRASTAEVIKAASSGVVIKQTEEVRSLVTGVVGVLLGGWAGHAYCY